MWDDFLQRKLTAVSLLILMIAFVIVYFGVVDVDEIDYARFLGHFCCFKSFFSDVLKIINMMNMWRTNIDNIYIWVKQKRCCSGGGGSRGARE